MVQAMVKAPRLTFSYCLTICRYFQQPTEEKAAFPMTDWSTLDLLGYKAYRMQGGGQNIWPA